jgi:hypothetical protein
VSLSPGALAKGGTQAGSLNQNIRASSGPSGDGPSGTPPTPSYSSGRIPTTLGRCKSDVDD